MKSMEDTYHKPTAEPYYLPYTSDHQNVPYSALLRAARLCSHYEDFNRERHRTDVSLLLSDYPPKLITNQFLRFFSSQSCRNPARTSKSIRLPTIASETSS